MLNPSLKKCNISWKVTKRSYAVSNGPKTVTLERLGRLPDGQEGLLYPPYDNYVLAEALVRLIEDKELREQLA